MHKNTLVLPKQMATIVDREKKTEIILTFVELFCFLVNLEYLV